MTYWLFGVDASFVPGRLLTWGLPLTVMFGAAVAAFMFTGLSIWEAALVGAILAPTDAALGQVVVTNPRVPQSSRTRSSRAPTSLSLSPWSP